MRFLLGILLIVSTTVRPQGIGDSVKTYLLEENMRYFLGFGINVVEKNVPDMVWTYGWQNNAQDRPFTDSTLFNLGSCSKLFTAIAIVKLAENGLLKLDDPVYYHFPEFLKIHGRNRDAHKVTIMHLLQHTSGITQSMTDLYPELFRKDVLKSEDEFYENTFNYRATLNRTDFLMRFMDFAMLAHPPGKSYHFSNLGYVILGHVIQELTGMNTGQFVTNHIFVPLGMHDSHYYITPETQEENLAFGYYRLSDGSYLNIHENEVESPSPTGDGGVKTSLRDMLRFMHYLTGDYRDSTFNQVLPRSALLSMMAPLVKAGDKQTKAGLGFHIIEPYYLIGHAGGWDGFLSILYYHPASHSCIFLVTNREDNELFYFLQVYAMYAMQFRKG